jgi:cytochrome c553
MRNALWSRVPSPDMPCVHPLEIRIMRSFLQSMVFSAALVVIPLPALAQGSAATEPLTAEERTALFPSRTMLKQGWDVANTACAECHGLDGASTGPGVPHLAGQRTVYLTRMLRAYQARARLNEDMNHAVGFLNDDALLAVSAYYSNLVPISPGEVEAPPDETVQAGGSDAFADIRDEMKKCVKCHGEDGNASGSGIPNLTAQDPAYFVQSMQAYRSGDRSHRLMQKLVAELDDDVLQEMGVFYAVQPPARTGSTGEGNADLGRSLAENCSNCHGADGNASGADMPTLAGQDARYFAKAILAYREGRRQHEKMFEAVDGLSEADVQNLAAYYAAQEPVRRSVRTPLTTNEWVNRCERCHGLDGNSTDPRFPMLAGQERAYLTAALKAYSDSGRTNSTMHAMSDPLSAADIERIVERFATVTPKTVVYMQLPCEDNAE